MGDLQHEEARGSRPLKERGSWKMKAGFLRGHDELE